ncbi:hypothetical protein [Kitasatospora sp. NPDC090091]|uniref:hypothetical protein n=1 Tax=Kitasatospora sp. NPDC090091 TaxID=3364081 RepID=UPI0038113F92
MSRTALQVARAVARVLGDGWTAESVGDASWAILEGPDELSLNVHHGATGNVLMEVRPNGMHVWPDRSEWIDSVCGSAVDAAGLAEKVGSRVLPAWRARQSVLAGKTELAKAALVTLTTMASELMPSATVEWGSRPNVATVRWPGGVAHLHGQGDGTVKFAALHLEHLDQRAGLRVLSALASEPAPDDVEAEGTAEHRFSLPSAVG